MRAPLHLLTKDKEEAVKANGVKGLRLVAAVSRSNNTFPVNPKDSSIGPCSLFPGKPYTVKVRVGYPGLEGEWSEATVFTPTFAECCVWKGCPERVKEEMKFLVNKRNPRIATKTNGDSYCTIIGNTPIPQNKVTSWNIRVLKSKKNS